MLARATPPLPDPADPRAIRLLDTLAELTAIGMDLARDLHREVTTAGPDAPAPSPDIALKFARIARAVRQSVALESRLAQELSADAQATDARHQREAEQRAVAARQAGFERKASAAYIFEQVAMPATETEAEREFLNEGVSEWLFDTTDDEAFLDKPVSEIILQICKDLQLQPDPALWTQEQWEADVRQTYARFDAASPAAISTNRAPASAPPTVQQIRAARYPVLASAAAHDRLNPSDDPPDREPPYDPAQTCPATAESAAGP